MFTKTEKEDILLGLELYLELIDEHENYDKEYNGDKDRKRIEKLYRKVIKNDNRRII